MNQTTIEIWKHYIPSNCITTITGHRGLVYFHQIRVRVFPPSPASISLWGFLHLNAIIVLESSWIS